MGFFESRNYFGRAQTEIHPPTNIQSTLQASNITTLYELVSELKHAGAHDMPSPVSVQFVQRVPWLQALSGAL
jgi:hypothetical protein